jgi:isopenicillin-N N-acyltransferase-like protein
MSALPIVELPGMPWEDGLAHGRAAAGAIAENLRIYYDRFQREARLTPAQTRERARLYLALIDRQAPAYGEAMRGVAAGAGIALDDVAVLNARYEILYSQYAAINQAASRGIPAGGCTAFAVTPEASADGHLYLGQNWDWFPAVRGVVLRRRPADGAPAIVAFTEAGIVGGKIGLNAVGLGLVINGLLSSRDDWTHLRTPFHVRTWRILQSRDLGGAVRVVTDEPRACSANFLIARAGDGPAGARAEVVDVEAAPHAACTLAPEEGLLVHANHFVEPERLAVWQPLAEEKTTTYHRAARLRALLAEGARRRALDAAGLMAILRDHDGHPDSVCRHPNPRLPEEERVESVVSVVQDLTAGRFYIAGGPPCTAPFVEIPLP